MGRMWLVCCSGEDAAWIHREIIDRETGARFLRVGEEGRLASLAIAFAGERPSVVLCDRSAGVERVEQTLGGLSQAGVSDIVVVWRDEDPGAIARLFYAGATEVIATNGMEAGTSAAARAERTEAGYIDAAPGHPPLDRDAFRGGRVRDVAGGFESGVPTSASALRTGGEHVAPDGSPLGVGAADSVPRASAPFASGRDDAAHRLDGPVDMGWPPLEEPGASSGAMPGGSPEAAARDLPSETGAGGMGQWTAPAASEPADDVSLGKGSATPTGEDGDGEPVAGSVQAAVEAAEAGVPIGSGAEKPDGGAPLIALVSGRGGSGKTTLALSMAACTARAGLRAAVLDLDLMFGNAYEVLGVDAPRGFETLRAHAAEGDLAERDIEAAAMRVGPGLTLWGPCSAPERAELMAEPAEKLIGVLRNVADIIFVDTPVFWGDAAAMAIACCERCLIVGGQGTSAASSAARALELATRIGVPRTRMTSVFNRMGARGCGEEQALRFEMGTSLRSRARIADGGDELASVASFTHLNSLIAGNGVFAQSIRAFTCQLMRELGHPIDQWLAADGQREDDDERPRIRLPWSQKADGFR